MGRLARATRTGDQGHALGRLLLAHSSPTTDRCPMLALLPVLVAAGHLPAARAAPVPLTPRRPASYSSCARRSRSRAARAPSHGSCSRWGPESSPDCGAATGSSCSPEVQVTVDRDRLLARAAPAALRLRPERRRHARARAAPLRSGRSIARHRAPQAGLPAADCRTANTIARSSSTRTTRIGKRLSVPARLTATSNVVVSASQSPGARGDQRVISARTSRAGGSSE